MDHDLEYLSPKNFRINGRDNPLTIIMHFQSIKVFSVKAWHMVANIELKGTSFGLEKYRHLLKNMVVIEITIAPTKRHVNAFLTLVFSVNIKERLNPHPMRVMIVPDPSPVEF